MQSRASGKSWKLLGPKANFEIQTCWIVAQFLAYKPVNFASLTDSFIVLFSKLLKLWSWMQTQQTKNSFPARKVTETFEKQSPDLTFSFSDKRSGSEIRCCETNLPVTQWHVFRLQRGPKASSPRFDFSFVRLNYLWKLKWTTQGEVQES